MYFGGGNSQVAISSDARAIGNQDPGGYVFSLGQELHGTWSLDTGAAFGHHLNTQADGPVRAGRAKFEAVWLAARDRLWWLPEYGVAPWWGGGVGYYRFRWLGQDYQLTGRGGFLAAGLDISLEGPWMVRAQVTRHWLPLRDSFGVGPLTTSMREYSASVIYRFGLH